MAISAPSVTATGSISISGATAISAPAPSVVVFAEALTSITGILVYIAGVDRTAYVANGTIDVTDPINSTPTARFRIIDRVGSYRPSLGSEVIIYRDGVRIFGGNLATISAKHEQESVSFIECSCAGYAAILERRIIGKHYTPAQGGIPIVTIEDILWNVIPDEGIWIADSAGVPAIDLGEQTFNYVTVADAFKQVLGKANSDYKIDMWKGLHMFAAGSGYAAAPYNISDANHRSWGSMQVDENFSRYANVVIVKNSQNFGSLQVDTFTDAAGQLAFETSYWFTNGITPQVQVNGTDATVVPFDSIADVPYDFYFFPGGIGIFRNQSSPLAGGETITATYPSALNYVYRVEDAAEITARAAIDGSTGRYEVVEEVKDFGSRDAMTSYGDAMLDRRKTPERKITFNTLLHGFYGGQTLTISSTSPYVASESFVVEEVRSSETPFWMSGRGKDFWYTIRATNNGGLATGSATRFLSQLVTRDKQAADRMIERITFVLNAGVDSGDQPDFTTGAKPAYRIAQKNGVCRLVTLAWYSVDVDGVITENDIEIDIFQNSVSIFPSGAKLLFPAGTTGTVSRFDFSADPLTVSQGDQFTISVLQADASAYAGTLELSIWG